MSFLENILKELDQFIMDEEQSDPYVMDPNELRYWPSAASVIINVGGVKYIEGTCHRATYWRMTGEPITNRTNAAGWLRMKMGKIIEEKIIEYVKKRGNLYDNNVEFNMYFDRKTLELKERKTKNTIRIKGEVDAFFMDGDEIVGIELKSSYGYIFTRDVIERAQPKLTNLMQTMLYLRKYQVDINPNSPVPVNKFGIFYLDRGNFKKQLIYVKLKKQKDGTHIPIINGVEHTYITVENILNRYIILDDYVRSKKLPPVEFQYTYTKERIEELEKIGKISASRKKNWETVQRYIQKKGVRPYDPKFLKYNVGDYQCSYCPFRDKCLKMQGIID